ncbi:MAG: TonB-dependent receptor [Pyrinomonadaceae bacterium]
MKSFGTLAILFLFVAAGFAQAKREYSGVVWTSSFELVPNVTIEAETSEGKFSTTSDSEGRFKLLLPAEPVLIRARGENLREFSAMVSLVSGNLSDQRIVVEYVVPKISEQVTIEADSLSPTVESKDSSIYENSLFSRDDQLIQTLNAGINAGQHEGGGKSLEIRRFGFNTDHGGVNGGLKIVVDNVQQNQGTQGHGQGYLGSLKSLSPELVESVSIINGPFSAAYGDFSGLGVVVINQRESLPSILTARFQGGSFDTSRAFVAFSPKIKKVDSFLAYKFNRTNGPFENPLRYRRDNLSGNFAIRKSKKLSFGLKFNGGRNSFYSSGQLPTDLIEDGSLNRFGLIDPDNGGFVESGSVLGYLRWQNEKGLTVHADAGVNRSLFDLYSNFTFFLADPIYGDEIQQHDSRLQESFNIRAQIPYRLFGGYSVATIGGGTHLSQINVGLYPSIDRAPSRKFAAENLSNPDVLFTTALADVNNHSGYFQNTLVALGGHFRVEAGLRWDYFSYGVNGYELGAGRTDLSGTVGKNAFQPKLGLAYSPSDKIPVTFHFNYGRGISSQDARGVIRNPDAPRISTTDFYQPGISYNSSRVSFVGSGFLIERSNEQVYIPDDGSIEFAGPTKSYGLEFRGAFKINRYLSASMGITNVLSSFYKDTVPRVYVDSAPRLTANAGLSFSGFRASNAVLSWRHISNYRLDGLDDSIRASGNDVVDLSISKRFKKRFEVSFAIDNVLDKKYYETQNFFESRVTPTATPIERIHATPGYPRTFVFGIGFRFGSKD